MKDDEEKNKSKLKEEEFRSNITSLLLVALQFLAGHDIFHNSPPSLTGHHRHP